jgi:hypothetical protein
MVTHSITGFAKAQVAAASAGRLRAGLMGCVAIACVAGFTAPLNSAAAQGECRLTPSLDQPPRKAPDDVCGADGITQRDFYKFSWQVFKFLVWPASSEVRGKSDTTKSITSMQGPRVFETFKASWEIFRPNAQEPVPWQEYPPLEPCSNAKEVPPGALVLASFSKFGNIKTGGGAVQSHVLVAQNRSYVRYQAGYNAIIFEKIKGSHLYDAGVVRTVPNVRAGEPVPEAAESPVGAIIVKSAWIELPRESADIDPSRFYVRDDAWVQDPKRTECRKASVGLVGLHVAYKTKSRPQWIWSTFEHVDNVPEPGDRAPKRYTFNNGNRQTVMTDDPEDRFLISKIEASELREPPTPYQVIRRQKIDEKVLQVNREWQGELGRINSVWQNYKLVMSEWPRVPSHPKRDAHGAGPTPKCFPTTPATANTTMETFRQRCDPELTCMGCHNSVRRTDFIWAIRLNQYQPPGFSGPSPREEAIKKLQEILGKGK